MKLLSKFNVMHTLPLHDEAHPKNKIFHELHSPDQMGRIFKKIEDKQMLTPIEAAAILLNNNKEHVKRVSGFKDKFPKKIKSVMIICADSRMGGMFQFDDFAKEGILPLYVAGNASSILSTPGIKEVFSRMEKGASVIIVGHSQCGAVCCAQHKEIYSNENNIRKLLKKIAPEEKENLSMQADELRNNAYFRKFAAAKGLHVTTAFVNINTPVPSIQIVDAKSATQKDADLVSRIDAHFKESNKGQSLSGHQYAHTIVISGNSMRFDARETFDCGANEIFSVSAGDFGGNKNKGKLDDALGSTEMAMLGLLDKKAIASIEYSIQKNSTHHILLLHTDSRVASLWEAELLQKSSTIANAVVAGNVEITTATYDPFTGRVVLVHHLVNEDAGKAVSAVIL